MIQSPLSAKEWRLVGLLNPCIGRGLVQQSVQCLVYSKRMGKPLKLVSCELCRLDWVVEVEQLQPITFLETPMPP